jgi:hypothetical protein
VGIVKKPVECGICQGDITDPFSPDISQTSHSGEHDIELGEPYQPGKRSVFQSFLAMFTGQGKATAPDYGYQNNGFFLMMDPAYAKQAYADDAFPQLRPRSGETGFKELGYDVAPAVATTEREGRDWVNGWRDDEALKQKFTAMITEPSTQSSDGDVAEMLREGESVLQMLQRISTDISAQSKHEDHLKHFEQLHRLFRSGVAPKVSNGLFQCAGSKGYNMRLDGHEPHDWYGEEEQTRGFDYYHGANLNLHWGFSETFFPDRDTVTPDAALIPGVGKYIFPWAGKSFEKISPRKLSMLLDESPDLAERYPQRVRVILVRNAIKSG